MDAAVHSRLTPAQRRRIEAKIADAQRDMEYLIRQGPGARGLVLGGGGRLRGAEFQLWRIELLQQVLDTDDVRRVLERAARAEQRAEELRDRDRRQAEDAEMEAALLRWAVEPMPAAEEGENHAGKR